MQVPLIALTRWVEIGIFHPDRMGPGVRLGARVVILIRNPSSRAILIPKRRSNLRPHRPLPSCRTSTRTAAGHRILLGRTPRSKVRVYYPRPRSIQRDPAKYHRTPFPILNPPILARGNWIQSSESIRWSQALLFLKYLGEAHLAQGQPLAKPPVVGPPKKWPRAQVRPQVSVLLGFSDSFLVSFGRGAADTTTLRLLRPWHHHYPGHPLPQLNPRRSYCPRVRLERPRMHSTGDSWTTACASFSFTVI